jgi:hypothetical protein
MGATLVTTAFERLLEDTFCFLKTGTSTGFNCVDVVGATSPEQEKSNGRKTK